MEKNNDKMWKIVAAAVGSLLALIGIARVVMGRFARKPAEDTVLYTI